MCLFVCVCKNAIDIENGFVFTHKTFLSFPNSIAKNTVQLKINSKTHIIYSIYFVENTVLYIVCKYILHVTIPFHTTTTTYTLVFQNTIAIEYFRKYSRFCLFIYLFFLSQVENGQKHVISHPFTKPFRQTPYTHIHKMCTINKTNSSKKFFCCCFFSSIKKLTAHTHTVYGVLTD